MKLRNLLIQLGKQYPKSSACFFDHAGYQTGNKQLDKEIKRIFLCLDLSEYCLAAIKEFKPDIILTHHPFFFGNKEEIRKEDYKKAQLESEILPLNCPVFSYHTNFDKAEKGMNTTLLSYLGFKDFIPLKDGMTRLVTLKDACSVKDILKLLFDKFPFETLSYYDFSSKVKTFAFLAGGGGNEFRLPLEEKADLYISGDISHHARLDLYRYRMNYIELPHECEEKGFLLGMKDFLLSLNPGFDILPFAYEKYFSVASKKDL